jgi:hypothetical protein
MPSANKDNFISSFPTLCPSISFSPILQWIGLAVQSQLEVIMANTLAPGCEGVFSLSLLIMMLTVVIHRWRNSYLSIALLTFSNMNGWLHFCLLNKWWKQKILLYLST